MTTYAVSHIRSGIFNDPECSRSTHRLQVTRGILEALGVKFVKDHTDKTYAPSYRAGWLVPEVHLCNHECKAHPLPEYVTDEIINEAWGLADTMIRSRAAFMRR